MSSQNPIEPIIIIETPDVAVKNVEAVPTQFQGHTLTLSSRRSLRNNSNNPKEPVSLSLPETELCSPYPSPDDPNSPFILSSRRLLPINSTHNRTPPLVSPPPSPTSTLYLQTPSFNSPTCNRNERQGYFPAPNQQVGAGSQLQASPSEPMSSPSCLTPGSYSSKDTNLDAATCSTESLSTTPPFPLNSTAPYKARRQSSDSLTMVKSLRRRKTEGSKTKLHQKHRCQGTCHHAAERKKDAGSWRGNTTYGPRQVAPTATGSSRHPKGSRRPKNRNEIRGLMSPPAKPLVTRRWSSVEIGTRQLKLAPLLRKNSGNRMKGISPIFKSDIFSSNSLGQRNRSSSFTSGAVYNDIIHILTEKLTIRKLPQNHMMMPSAITLRRPSVQKESNVDKPIVLLTPAKALNGSGQASPLSQQQSREEVQENSEAYIITRADIDSITEMLRRSFQEVPTENYTEVHPHGLTSEGSRSPRSSNPSSVSVTSKGLTPRASAATCQILKFAAVSEKSRESSIVQPKSVSSSVSGTESTAPCPNNTGKYLQIAQNTKPSPKRTSRVASAKSLHEVIWEERDSPRRMSCATDIKLNDKGCDSGCSTPSPRAAATDSGNEVLSVQCSQVSKQLKDRLDREVAGNGVFDPQNARASISNWSWQCETEDGVHENEADAMPNQNEAAPTISVISFPPLPRKSTNEWRSPLPDIGKLGDSCFLDTHDHESNPLRRSLYEIGIDACTGILLTPSTNNSPVISRIRTNPIDAEAKVSWLTNIQTVSRPKSDTDLHRKSVIKAHPHAPARSGDSSKFGSSIGSCTGARRCQNVKRVTTIDKPNNDNDHAQWAKCRQDSVYPRMSRDIGVEDEIVTRWSTLATRHTSKATYPETPSRSHSPHSMLDLPPLARPLSLSLPVNKDTPTLQVSLARQSLTAILDSYPSSPKALSRKQSLLPRKSSAWESLTKVLEKYPQTTREEMSDPLLSFNEISPKTSRARSSLSLLQGRVPTIPRQDHSGIYDKFTGIRNASSVKCDRDCRPLIHDCDTCGYETTPSVDWIG